MNQFQSVYILQPLKSSWIIEKLMSDIANQLAKKGVKVRIGPRSAYDGEEIVFHSRYLYVQTIKEAKVNSIFVTHIDDKLKEFELKREIKKKNHNFVCMSPLDAKKLVQLGCKKRNVIGLNLPHRGGYIRYPRIAIFSDYYNDNRKNEGWIDEYIKSVSKKDRNKIIFSFLGHGWEDFGKKLNELGGSYEIYSYNRDMDGEYEAQRKY